jgi:hypothetical protein
MISYKFSISCDSPSHVASSENLAAICQDVSSLFIHKVFKSVINLSHSSDLSSA